MLLVVSIQMTMQTVVVMPAEAQQPLLSSMAALWRSQGGINPPWLADPANFVVAHYYSVLGVSVL